FFQAEDGIRDFHVTGVQTCALPILLAYAGRLRGLLWAALAVLGVQIALGGWVSANYAALSCGAGGWSMENFPQCAGMWLPPTDLDRKSVAEGKSVDQWWY